MFKKSILKRKVRRDKHCLHVQKVYTDTSKNIWHKTFQNPCFKGRQSPALCCFLSLRAAAAVVCKYDSGSLSRCMMGIVRREDTLLGGGGVRSLFIKVCCTEPASVPPSASNVIHPSFSSSLFSTHPNVPPSLSLLLWVSCSLSLSQLLVHSSSLTEWKY